MSQSVKSATPAEAVSDHETLDTRMCLVGYTNSQVKAEDVSLFRIADSSVKHPDMNKGFELNRLNSRRFASWFSLATKKNSSECKKALAHLADLAAFDTSIPKMRMFTRIGTSDGKIYLNLCNAAHEVVEISENGWTIISETSAPVLFTKNTNLKELPSPLSYTEFTKNKVLRDKAFDSLRSIVNTTKEDFCCVVGWLVVALNPSMECPILWVSAGKGRGKTTLTNFLKSLIDPDESGALAPFEKEKDFRTAASSRHIIALDNFSKLKEKWSNLLCRAVTGEGAVQRKLYSDNSAFDIRIRVPMIINGIDFRPGRSDLQDRCFPITLQKLASDSRRTKHDLENFFEKEHQLILSALLNAVCAALRNKNYKPKGTNVDVRMFDASLFIMKAAATAILS